MGAKTLFISWAAILILKSVSLQQATTTASAESLQCTPGEERHFEYESATKVWETAKDQLRLKSKLKVRCMESGDNSTLKYLVEVVSLEPSYEETITKGAVRAEPVLEEVSEAISEAANRVKRSVSGWFTKTWGSVKDFFLTIFTPSERKTVSREQVLNQDGIDIAAQCKAGGKSGKMPIDDSVFDDLEPKYYIGASLDSTGGLAFEFDNRNSDDDEDDNLLFFDDPKSRESRKRSKRAASLADSRGASSITNLGTGTGNNGFNDGLLKLPFVFVQSRTGKILEIQFSQQDKDVSVRNFKRHLCDLFATSLDKDKSHLNEVTPLGQHSTKYTLNSSSNKQSQQFVRAMAVVGMQSASTFNNEGATSGRVSSADGGSSSSLGDTSLSVLRTINHTNSINSRTMMPDIDRMQVRVKQVQQINDGRMIGTMGQLGMSLLQTGNSGLEFHKAGKQRYSRSVNRNGRQPSPLDETHSSSEPVEDIADLLKVSTSFSLQMVPQVRARSLPDDKIVTGRTRRSAKLDNSTLKQNNTIENRFIVRPVDLAKTMQDLQLLESKLQLRPSSLITETDRAEGKAQRLEVLQDQIQMRINEEYLQNKLRLANLKLAASRQATGGVSDSATKLAPSKRQVLGLSLTQIVLDNGVTAKRKGSIYATIEEAIELESSLGEDLEEGSMSRLLRDTVRMDNIRTYCRSSIASLDEIRAQNERLQLKLPFAIEPEKGKFLPHSEDYTGDQQVKLERVVTGVMKKNRRRLDHCKQVLQLLLRVNERQAVDLVIDLIDESNNRLLSISKEEELGYGPTSRYYRNLRQQFTELLGNINRPSETMLDKLMARLPYLTPKSSASTGQRKASREDELSKPKPEFVYVAPKSSHENHHEQKHHNKYNRSLLKELDDSNNNEGAGSLVMSITSLASKASISERKRVDIIEKLLFTIKSSSCNLFEGPDLDILESMANFNEPLDELTGKLVHLARRCKHQDQYLVACVHGLQGQLRHSVTQRFLADLLKSSNVSCIVKSEIVLTLVDAILINDLKQASSMEVPSRNDINSAQSHTQINSWPSSGLNQVDDIMLDLTGNTKKSTTTGNGHSTSSRQNSLDKKCLGQLVTYYMSKKRPIGNDILSSNGQPSSSNNKRARSRNRRSVRNENNFWDEAHCKRWSIQPNVVTNSNGADNSSVSLADLADELDDNSILQSLANKNISNLLLSSRLAETSATGVAHRAERLIEKEADEGALVGDKDANFVRKRHKCSASKTYGPKNAEATLKAEIVNDLVGQKDENKFLARFRLSTNFLGNRIDVGRMYLWHQKRTTRAHVNILGKSLWDTSHSCQDKPPNHLLYVPLFDFNLWLVKVSVGMRLQSEMGFYSNCRPVEPSNGASRLEDGSVQPVGGTNDQLELYPTITTRASGEATAKFVVAKVGLSLASQYGYQGSIRVSRQPESCMSIHSAHQPMNVTFSSWFQLWDNDCHYWGSRKRAEPQATRWKLAARQPTTWLDDECLQSGASTSTLPTKPSNKPTTIGN